MLSPYQFQPNNPNSVNTGQHVQPGGGGGNTFANILGGLANAGLGYATGGLGGAAANILGSLGVGGTGGSRSSSTSLAPKATSSAANTGATSAVNAANDATLDLAASDYLPDLGQPLNQMDPNNVIAPQAIDFSLQGEPVPYINPYKWEY